MQRGLDSRAEEKAMALTDSTTGKVIRDYSIEQLKEAANMMRGYDLVELCAAGSGHSGGTLSIMDIVAALYLHVAQHDPKNPNWPDRDRIIWSAGHKAPALYVGLGYAGFCDINDVVTLRKLHSRVQGHAHWLKLPGVEVSSGSLGQGLSIAVGMALSARLDGKKHKIFCLMGDGEQQEGQGWEAAMEAAHYKLDNIIAVIDVNRLQIDGWVKDVMEVEPLDAKYKSFGWEVMRVDGHDMKQLVDAFDKAKTIVGKPVIILADTIKGKGVSFMENVVGWHGKPPNREELDASLKELGLTERIPVQKLLDHARNYQAEQDRELDAKMPKFSRDFWWNAGDSMKVKMEPTRKGFGKSLAANGDDERIVCLGLDISGSITISDFYAGKPERARRWISMGIAEQSATSAAAGFAREGKLPVLGSYATFMSAQVGYTVGYHKVTNIFNVSWNRSQSQTTNFFTNGTDIATQIGILGPGGVGLNSSPLNYGLPRVTMRTISGLSQQQPTFSVAQTTSASEVLSWIHGKHNLRFGGDYRRVHRDFLGGSNATGSFTFTGLFTEDAAGDQTTGSPLADFLLGLPQATTIDSSVAKSYLRDNVYDAFAQDDWRATPSLTLNIGLRYEFYAPYTEKFGHIAFVDTNPAAGFTGQTEVVAGGTGPFSGKLPGALVFPYHKAIAPRLAFAWRVPKLKQTVIRGGYGMNFTVGQYAGFATSMAHEPPFANEQTNEAATASGNATSACARSATAPCFTLARGFPSPDTTGNYAVDPHYPLPHVQA